MYIYFFIASIALTTVFIPSKKYMAIVLLVFSIICGARDGVLGYDFIVYKNYFDGLASNGNIYNYEIGYYWLNYFFNGLDFSFSEFLFFVSIIYHFSLFVILIYLKKELGLNPGWVLFFYVTSGSYFWHSYTLLRQSFVISIFYLSIAMSLNRAIIFNFLSPFFHVSAIINVLILASLKIKGKITNRNIIFVSLFLVFCGFILKNIFNEQFEVYGLDQTATILVLGETIVQSLLLLFLIRNGNFSYFTNVIVLSSISFCILGFLVNMIFIRFIEPYKIIMIMSYALFLLQIKKKSQKLYIGVASSLVILSYLRMYRFFDNFGDYAVPYVSIFDSAI